MIDRILYLMEMKGINANQLTEKLELSKSAITDWKKGKAKPSVDAIIKLSIFFEVSTDFLLLGKENKSSYKEHTLSEDECKLLDSFRQIGDEEKLHTLALIQLMAKEKMISTYSNHNSSL